MKTLLPIAAALLLAGCVSGNTHYEPAGAGDAKATNSKTVNKPREEVWAAAVPALGKQFYVINNVDKGSGLINLTFSASNPDHYVDCGQFTVTVEGPRPSNVSFSGASADERYQAFLQGSGLAYIHRKMALDGRVNLIFEEAGPRTTRVTANVRYTLTRTATVQRAAVPYPQTLSHSIGFNSGGRETFPASSGQPMQCMPTSALERHILSLIPD